MKVELFKGKDGWRWRLRGVNGEILSTSEAYTRKSDAKKSARLIHGAIVKGDNTVAFVEEAPRDWYE